jgi:hypothetical protein
MMLSMLPSQKVSEVPGRAVLSVLKDPIPRTELVSNVAALQRKGKVIIIISSLMIASVDT